MNQKEIKERIAKIKDYLKSDTLPKATRESLTNSLKKLEGMVEKPATATSKPKMKVVKKTEKASEANFVEDLTAAGVPKDIIDGLYKTGWKVTTEGEKKGSFTSKFTDYREEYQDRIKKHILDLWKKGDFEAGFKYVDWPLMSSEPKADHQKSEKPFFEKFKKKYGFVKLADKTIKEKNGWSGKYDDYTYEIWCNDKAVIAYSGGYSSLYSTEWEYGYAMWLDIINGGVPYLKDTDAWKNALGGITDPEENLKILKACQAKNKKSPESDTSKVKVGQVWEHNSGEYQAKVVTVDPLRDKQIEVDYTDGGGGRHSIDSFLNSYYLVDDIEDPKKKKVVSKKGAIKKKVVAKKQTSSPVEKSGDSKIEDCKKALQEADYTVTKVKTANGTKTIRKKRPERQIVVTKTQSIMKTVTKDIPKEKKENPDFMKMIDVIAEKLQTVLVKLDKMAKAGDEEQIKNIYELLKGI